MFIGTKKISSHEEVGDFVEVKFDDKTTEKFSKSQFKFLQTKEALDLSDYQHRKLLHIESILYGVLKEHVLTLEDIKISLNRLQMSIGDNVSRAITKKFGKENTEVGKQSIPIGEIITLQDIHETL